ncbi:hypothetical protein TWF730_004480 [Orbilia blumenaviensis]|uniref:Uncharacterized protein n=1 Tax=Orbilia blumenaviensis TaxID=1796055 RepID=A0AAV9TYV3_9PEZI
MQPAFQFLKLPRELRDLIYQFNIIHPATPTSNTEETEPYGRPTLENAALLRVCRQVHDELAEVFYGWTVFPIQIRVKGPLYIHRSAVSFSTTYRVHYDSPWEWAFFIFYADCEERFKKDFEVLSGRWFGPPGTTVDSYSKPGDKGTDASTTATSSLQDGFPAAKYCPLIRHLRIDIFITAQEPELIYRKLGGGVDVDYSSILSAFSARLENIFGATSAASAASAAVATQPGKIYLQVNVDMSLPDEMTKEAVGKFFEMVSPMMRGSWIRKLSLDVSGNMGFEGGLGGNGMVQGSANVSGC